MHHHKAGKGHRKVVAQTPLGQNRRDGLVRFGGDVIRTNALEVFATVQNFEQQAIAFEYLAYSGEQVAVKITSIRA